jgi:hypothetical protein
METRLQRAVLREGGWEFLFSRAPRDFPEDRAGAELLIGGEEGEWRSLGDLPIVEEVEPEYRGTALSTDILIDPTEGGAMMRSTFLRNVPPALTPEGKLERRALPAGNPARRPDFDYEVTDRGLRPIAVFGDDLVWLSGRWLQLTDGQEPSLVEAGAQGGEPLTNRFWLWTGFKVLPAEGGGYWVMGSLGESYLRLDDSLRRVDSLSAIERFFRLFEKDRAKRNSDFYLNAAPLKKASVPAMLFALPLGLLLAAAAGAKRRRSAMRIVLGAYLFLGLVLGWWAWALLKFL